MAIIQDIVAYLIAFLASHVQEKEYKPSGFTYALHRAELVGAFFNGVFLLALALSIFLQSMERFINIEFVENPLLMLIVGCIGLSLNLISASIVHGKFHLHLVNKSVMVHNFIFAEHGHGHGHGSTPPTKGSITEPNDGVNMEVAEIARTSFSIAMEEHNMGDIVRVFRI
jgi:solute carrier family 30 (zinc transporter), member 1